MIQSIENKSIYELIHKFLFVLKKRIEYCADLKLKVYTGKWVCYSTHSVNVLMDDGVELENAEQILHGRYSWLGMSPMEKTPLIWNQDFISGYVWRNQYFQKIRTVDLSKGIDVKIPWELSRLQHFPTLALAYRESGDTRYLDCIRSQLWDWEDKNPYKHSINWTCSMEVAIRAINVIMTMLILPEIATSKRDAVRINNILYLHGMYIRGNLETYDLNFNNHYLSDLLGLLWIGCFLVDKATGIAAKKCEQWISFANCALHKELWKQVNTDGTDYESSICYHRLVCEIYLLRIYICKAYGVSLDAEDEHKTLQMLLFLERIRKPDGGLPIIGDMDDGRILILENYVSWDRRGADFLLRRRSQYLSGDFGECFDEINPMETGSVAYRDGGYYLLRNEKVYCMLHCGPLSMNGHGGHSHNDQLGVIVSFDGLDYIIDPGSGTYTRDEAVRNTFRSTRYHSTLEVQGCEQNTIYVGKTFELPEETFSECNYFDDSHFEGTHFGYLKCGLRVSRTVDIDSTSVTVIDSIKKMTDECRLLRQNFILDSNVEIGQCDDSHSLLLSKNGLSVLVVSTGMLTYEEITVSPTYGRFLPSHRISTVWDDTSQIETTLRVVEA